MRLILPSLVVERPPLKTASRAGPRSAGAGVEGKRGNWSTARAESHSTACAANASHSVESRPGTPTVEDALLSMLAVSGQNGGRPPLKTASRAGRRSRGAGVE